MPFIQFFSDYLRTTVLLFLCFLGSNRNVVDDGWPFEAPSSISIQSPFYTCSFLLFQNAFSEFIESKQKLGIVFQACVEQSIWNKCPRFFSVHWSCHAMFRLIVDLKHFYGKLTAKNGKRKSVWRLFFSFSSSKKTSFFSIDISFSFRCLFFSNGHDHFPELQRERSSETHL